MKSKPRKALLFIPIILTCLVTFMPQTTKAFDFYINANDPGGTTEGQPGQISNIVTSVANVLFFAAGAAAVIFLAYGGVSYITSGGDDTKAAQARKIIINAFIGVILVSLTYKLFNAATSLGGLIKTGINTPQEV